MKHLILASASPRRRELLRQIGIDFEIMLASTDESCNLTLPSELVEALSLRKAQAVADTILKDGCVVSSLNPDYADLSQIAVLGSDTVVAIDDQVLGKPKDKDHALSMLRRLQGKTHRVYTGVSMISPTKAFPPVIFHEYTEVTMYPASDEELLSYIECGEPMDKAGSYGIQGRGGFLIKEIHGDYNTVVGLPASRVYQELKKL